MNKRSIVCLALTFGFMLFFLLTSFFVGTQDEDDTNVVSRGNERSVYNFLLLGKDDAAGLCDMIMIGSLDMAGGKMTIMQIPRDTYFNYTSDDYKKINGMLNSVGKVDLLVKELSDALGVNIDYYACMDVDAVISLVDAVGGVEIDLPRNMDYEDAEQGLSIHLKAGRQNLGGEQAVKFLRFRSGYVRGDLSRMDAQKIFCVAFAKRISSFNNPLALLSIFKMMHGRCQTNLDEQEFLSLAYRYAKIKPIKIFLLSAPGEDVRSEISGAWYYVLSKEAMGEALGRYFASPDKFDRENKFVNKNDASFYEIYNRYCEYKIYSSDEIENNEINLDWR